MALAREAGFPRAGIVDPRLLQRRWLPEVSGGPAASAPVAEGIEWEWIASPSKWSVRSTVLVCCLSCLRPEPDDPGTAGDPLGLVAPFARAHYYREAVHMLAGVARRLEQEAGLPGSSIRLFSNSRLPEKPLLVATGLAAYGRNGCAIAPGLGSMFVIAGAVLPVPTRLAEAVQPLPDPCGSCRSCQAACPVHAIDQPYVVRRDRCLQSLATTAEAARDSFLEHWGCRLYGCQDCQAACPHNRGLRDTARPSTGEIGAGVPLRAFLSEDDEARAKRLRGTALGASWLPREALVRNALVAAGGRGDASLRPEVERYLRPEGPESIRRAARWARDRL